MAPEQARGKPVDKRADIWAFGAVLFEMLSGTQPFPGEDTSHTLARVIERDPDWDALPDTLPVTVDVYLRQCLQKAPQDRVRDIGDMRLALAGAFETGMAAAAGPNANSPPPSLWRRGVPWVAAVAVALASAGATNLGLVDDLRGIGEACHTRNVWFHVDGAYGGAALAAPSARGLFDGVELADSFIVDPHKWLLAPFDCCALLYREPARAQAVHAQHADYLDFLDAWGDWNPSDFAIHLTRRARGLPFWFSLATYGTDAYADAVQVTLDLAQAASRRIDATDHLELAHTPSLSVVVFRRLGWDADQYTEWTVRTMKEGTAFVVPSRYQGEPVFRFCFVNPRTTVADIDLIIDALV